jgi:hypothetical protein
VLGVLCLLEAPGRSYSADRVSSRSKPSASAPFNFDDFTKHKHFRLNTLPTTVVDGTPTPAWADILLAPQNFVACKGAKIALCYYSGPGPVTSCDLSNPGIANCTCYAIPEGHPYFVDINAILNLDVYLDTVKKCGSDGSDCQPWGPHEAPVCRAIGKKTLIPGADLISTFSLALDGDYPIDPANGLQCPGPNEPNIPYAGCMTAPCKSTVDPVTGLPPRDPVTGHELVQCACPTYTGPYQVGYPNGNACGLGGDNVWSAAYTVPPEPPTPPIPPIPPHNCWPDAPGDTGCPLLPDGFIPPPPPNASCREVCSEYKQSNQKGIQVGFTCDATLCTAASDPALVAAACTGLAKHSVSEILKLETEVGYSCAARQICSCEPNKKTNDQIFRLNEAQRQLTPPIQPQCDYNGTLCGTQP